MANTPPLARPPLHPLHVPGPTAAACVCPAPALQGQHLSKLSPCDVKALQKCLQENKGDRAKVRGRCTSAHAALHHLLQAAAAAVAAAVFVIHYLQLYCCVWPFVQCEKEVLAFQQACSRPASEG